MHTHKNGGVNPSPVLQHCIKRVANYGAGAMFYGSKKGHIYYYERFKASLASLEDLRSRL